MRIITLVIFDCKIIIIKKIVLLSLNYITIMRIITLLIFDCKIIINYFCIIIIEFYYYYDKYYFSNI